MNFYNTSAEREEILDWLRTVECSDVREAGRQLLHEHNGWIGDRLSLRAAAIERAFGSAFEQMQHCGDVQLIAGLDGAEKPSVSQAPRAN